MESCSWPPIFVLVSTCFCVVASSLFVILVYSCWAWKRIGWADTCVSHLSNRLPCAGHGTDIPTTEVTEADCNHRMALGDSLLNLSIGSTSATSSPPTKSSWLRSLENNQFLTPPHQRPSQSFDSNHNSSGGDKRMLKPSRLGSLGNGETLLGSGTWKHSRRPVPHINSHTPHNDNVFQLMNGLTLKEPANGQCPTDHLNWRGRKKLQLPNGFGAAYLKNTKKDSAHISDDDAYAKDVACVTTHAGKRRVGGNGTLESRMLKRNCRTSVLVVCLLTSLVFNGVLITMFIHDQ